MSKEEYIENLKASNDKLFDLVKKLQKTVEDYEGIIKDFKNLFEGSQETQIRIPLT